VTPVATRELAGVFDQGFALADVERGESVSDGERLTLGRKLDSVWEGLLAAGAAACPVCSARLERAGDQGRCAGCGSTLA
jgi:hypothetical protein